MAKRKRFKFWMVWRENSPTTHYRHARKKSAKKEAERLAKTCPGEVFYVLKAVDGVIANAPVVKPISLVKKEDPEPGRPIRDDEIPF